MRVKTSLIFPGSSKLQSALCARACRPSHPLSGSTRLSFGLFFPSLGHHRSAAPALALARRVRTEALPGRCARRMTYPCRSDTYTPKVAVAWTWSSVQTLGTWRRRRPILESDCETLGADFDSIELRPFAGTRRRRKGELGVYIEHEARSTIAMDEMRSRRCIDHREALDFMQVIVAKRSNGRATRPVDFATIYTMLDKTSGDAALSPSMLENAWQMFHALHVVAADTGGVDAMPESAPSL